MSEVTEKVDILRKLRRLYHQARVHGKENSQTIQLDETDSFELAQHFYSFFQGWRERPDTFEKFLQSLKESPNDYDYTFKRMKIEWFKNQTRITKKPKDKQ